MARFEAERQALAMMDHPHIAKVTCGELTRKTLFTRHEQMIGAPEYMAREQAELNGLDIDTRADVYSLGVLLYEQMTGTLPFDITAALRVGYNELLRTIREVRVVREARVTHRGSGSF